MAIAPQNSAGTNIAMTNNRVQNSAGTDHNTSSIYIKSSSGANYLSWQRALTIVSNVTVRSVHGGTPYQWAVSEWNYSMSAQGFTKLRVYGTVQFSPSTVGPHYATARLRIVQIPSGGNRTDLFTHDVVGNNTTSGYVDNTVGLVSSGTSTIILQAAILPPNSWDGSFGWCDLKNVYIEVS